MSNPAIRYVAKPKSVTGFGASSKEEFSKWVPEICGICCLKMVGDTLNKTQDMSLWELTQHSIELGVFTVSQNGSIRGAYHRPLAELAVCLGLKAKTTRWLPGWRLKRLIAKGQIPILSIDLDRMDPPRGGGHLIVVIAYDKKANEFIVHDPSSVLAKSGEAARISSLKLGHLSNGRGLIFSR